MPDFDSQDFVDVAQYILEDVLTSPTQHEQAFLRTIAGRSYYAAYGRLRRRIVTECSDCFGSAGRHKDLSNLCADSGNAHLEGIGQKLKFLLASRVRADYSWIESVNISVNEAEDAIYQARRACQKIGTLQLNDIRELHDGL